MKKTILGILMVSAIAVHGQESTFSLDQAIEYALKNNAGVKASSYEVESQKQLRKTSFDLPKTEVSLLYGQYNSYFDNDNNITISQSIPFTSFGSQAKLNRSLLASSELKRASTENNLIFAVKQAYYQLAYAYSLKKLLVQQDSLFEEFARAASFRYRAGETKLLEQTTAEAQRNEAKNRLRQNESDIIVLRTQLKSLLNSGVVPDIEQKELTQLLLPFKSDTSLISANPSLALARQQIEVTKSERKVQAAKAAPDLVVGFFSQTLVGTDNPETGQVANSRDRFTGFQVGVSLPIWYRPQQGRIRAAEYNRLAAESNYTSQQLNLKSQLEQAIKTFEKNQRSLEYYQTSALPNADLILKQSQAGFRGGDIGYTEFLIGVRNAISIREDYLETLHEYNQSIIFIEFLSGNK